MRQQQLTRARRQHSWRSCSGRRPAASQPLHAGAQPLPASHTAPVAKHSNAAGTQLSLSTKRGLPYLLTAADISSSSNGRLDQALLLLAMVDHPVVALGRGLHYHACGLDVTQLGILGQLLLLQTRGCFQTEGLHAKSTTVPPTGPNTPLPGACRSCTPCLLLLLTCT